MRSKTSVHLLISLICILLYKQRRRVTKKYPERVRVLCVFISLENQEETVAMVANSTATHRGHNSKCLCVNQTGCSALEPIAFFVPLSAQSNCGNRLISTFNCISFFYFFFFYASLNPFSFDYVYKHENLPIQLMDGLALSNAGSPRRKYTLSDYKHFYLVNQSTR